MDREVISEGADEGFAAIMKGFEDKIRATGMDYGLEVISTLIMIHKLADRLPAEQAKQIQLATFNAFQDLAKSVQSGQLKTKPRFTS